MKKLYDALQRYSFPLILCLLIVIIFRPLLLKQQIPFSANLLVSFFNPWAQEKMIGWEQGIPNKPVGIDDLRIFYPQRYLTTLEYKEGILPLWNQESFSGNYIAGLSETAVFYPFFLLFILLPQLPLWIVLIILEPIAITIGMYLYLRLLNLSKPAVIFGSIVLGFSGLVMVRMVEGMSVGHTLLWIPFVLFGVEGFFQKKKTRYLFLLLFAMSATLFAGWFQYAFYTILLGGIYALFRWIGEKDKKQNLFVFLPFIILPFITLIQIIPAFESFVLSSRGATTTKELLDLHLMPPSHLLTYIFPDFFGNPGAYNFFGKSEYKESILYIGVIPFILSLFGIFLWKQKYVLFFSCIAVVGIFLGIENSLTKAILSLPIPIVSSFLPNRVFYFATIGLSVLSAYGMDVVLAKKLSWIRIIFVGLITVLVAVVANGFVFFSSMERLSTLPLLSSFAFLKTLHIIGQAYQIEIAKHNLYIPDLLLVSFIVALLVGRIFSKKLLIVGIFLLTIFGQVYFAQKYIPFSQIQFVFPSNEVFSYLRNNGGIDRFVSTGNGYITTNSSLMYGLYSPDGVSSMYLERYGQLVTYMQTEGGKDFVHIPRIEIRIAPSADELLSGSNPFLLRFMQIDGIKYVVRLKSDPATVDSLLFTKVWENDKWIIYAFNKVLPRVFWTNTYASVVGNNKLALDKLFHSTSIDPKAIVLEKFDKKGTSEGVGRAQIISYKPNFISINTQSNTQGFVYISDNYVPQWSVYVDGKKTQLLRANYTFQAVHVVKGDHSIVLKYEDQKETIGLVITFIAILGSIVAGVILTKKRLYSW